VTNDGAGDAPGAEGACSFRGVASGRRLPALPAPAGPDPTRLSALSVQADPGQFSVVAAARRDVGINRPSL
jgi:hypothetical protein